MEINGKYYTIKDLQYMADYFKNQNMLIPSDTASLLPELQETVIKQLPNYRSINKSYAKDKQTYINNYCNLSLDNVLHYLSKHPKSFNMYVDYENNFEFYTVNYNNNSNTYKINLFQTELKNNKIDTWYGEMSDSVNDVIVYFYNRNKYNVNFNLQFVTDMLVYYGCRNYINVYDLLLSKLSIYPHVYHLTNIVEYFNNIKAHIYLSTIPHVGKIYPWSDIIKNLNSSKFDEHGRIITEGFDLKIEHHMQYAKNYVKILKYHHF